MSEENKSVFRRFVTEVCNSGRLELIDILVAPDYVSHVVHTPPIKNRDELKRWVADVRAAFPDVQFTIEDLLADDDKTIARWSSEASHEGVFLGVSGTGQRAVCRGITISRYVDGRIAEEWGEWDALRLKEQIEGTASQRGVVPAATFWSSRASNKIQGSDSSPKHMIDSDVSTEFKFPNPHLGDRVNHNIIRSENRGRR